MAVRPIDGNDFMRRLTLDTSKGHYGEFTDGSEVAFTSREIAEFVEQMPTLTPPNEPERAGLYGKYTVYKNKDGSLVNDCFILRPAKDPAAVTALRAYADATDNAELAADIIRWVGAGPNEPLTCEGCIHEHNEHENCNYCKRVSYLGDYYYRPPEGEADD